MAPSAGGRPPDVASARDQPCPTSARKGSSAQLSLLACARSIGARPGPPGDRGSGPPRRPPRSSPRPGRSWPASGCRVAPTRRCRGGRRCRPAAGAPTRTAAPRSWPAPRPVRSCGLRSRAGSGSPALTRPASVRGGSLGAQPTPRSCRSSRNSRQAVCARLASSLARSQRHRADPNRPRRRHEHDRAGRAEGDADRRPAGPQVESRGVGQEPVQRERDDGGRDRRQGHVVRFTRLRLGASAWADRARCAGGATIAMTPQASAIAASTARRMAAQPTRPTCCPRRRCRCLRPSGMGFFTPKGPSAGRVAGRPGGRLRRRG